MNTLIFHRSGQAVTILLAAVLLLTVPASTFSAQEQIKIAAIFSLTGPAANSNRSSVLGTRLAVDEINNAGGVLERKLNLILLDNMSTPIGSSIAANQAVKTGAAGIIGAQFSSHSLAIADVAQQYHVPMISNYSTHPQLTGKGRYIFRVCFTDEFQGKVMAEFAHQDLEAKTALVLVDLASDYSLELSKLFRQHFTDLGGTVVGEIEYKKTADFDSVTKHILPYDVDVIFLSGHEESGIIAKKLQDSGETAILLGGDGWSDRSFFEQGGDQLKTGYFCSHWSPGSDRQLSRNFVEQYGHMRDFGTGAALAYDAVRILAEALRTAPTLDGASVSAALFDLQKYEGVTGDIKFNRSGDPVKDAIIMKVTNGTARFYKSFSAR